MNQQNTMAGKTAADLVQAIATSLYGEAGASITDLITLANRVQAEASKQQVGESCTHEWRTAVGGSQARRPLVCSKCNQHRDHMPQQVGEVQGDRLASLPLYRMADDANGKRELHRDDTGSWVKIQDVERALAARQPVEPVLWCMHFLGPDELNAFGQNMRSQFRDALALIDGQAVQS